MPSRRLQRRGALAVIALAAVLAACDDDGTRVLTPAERAAAIRSLIEVGQGSNDRVLRAGRTARVAARVTDVAGLPVADVPVVWTTASGGGSVAVDGANTDTEGFSRGTWTAGTAAGIQEVVATVNGGTGVFDRSDLVVFADTVVGTLDLTPDADSVRVGSQVVVRITSAKDQYGNPYVLVGTQPDNPPPIEFTSLNPTWAVLTATTARTAVVKGLAVGNARIVARSDGKADTVTVHVTAAPAALHR